MTGRCPVPHDPAPPPALRVERRSGLRTTLGFVRDPFGALESTPERGDVVLTRLFGVPAAVLAHPSLVAEVLRDGKGTWI